MEEPSIPELHSVCFFMSLQKKCPKAYALVGSLIRQEGCRWESRQPAMSGKRFL